LVVFITTNHAQKLDAALTRPGRVDCRVSFGYPSRDALRQALTMLGDLWPSQHDDFLTKIDAMGIQITVAKLQQYLFNCMQIERTSIIDHMEELREA
jgi:chaperone BCS1